MANQLIDAAKLGWAMLEDQRGSLMRVTIGATSDIECNILEVNYDEVIVAGGKADKGAAKFDVAEADCPDAVRPEKNVICTTSDGDTGYVLSVKRLHGMLTVIIGEPSGYRQGEHGFI